MRLCSLLTLGPIAALAGACLPPYETNDSRGSDSAGTGVTSIATTDTPTTGDGATTGVDPTVDPTADPTTTPANECGDGELDGGEVCDGPALGGKSCADVDDGFVGGTLACAADCGAFDTSGCTLAPGAAPVALNEVTSKGVALGPYADLGDAVELYNAGAAGVDLSGWKLSDDPAFPTDKTYVFPPGSSLAPGAFLVLVELDPETMMVELPFGITSSGTETLTLADSRGVVQDQLTLDGADAAVSYCRLPDGTGSWQACAQTFGAANSADSAGCGDGVKQDGEECDGADLGGQTCAGLGHAGGVLGCTAACMFDDAQCIPDSGAAINELESGADQIELYNAGAQALNLSGWILTDDAVDPNYDPMADTEKLVFAAGTTIAAKQFLVVAKGVGPGQHPFGLSADGDTVTLLRPDLTVVDQVTYGANQAAVSYCRLPDGPGGAWTAGCQPTFGAANKGP